MFAVVGCGMIVGALGVRRSHLLRVRSEREELGVRWNGLLFAEEEDAIGLIYWLTGICCLVVGVLFAFASFWLGRVLPVV